MPVRLHGQTAMQMPQPWVSLKYGMHLSKSTYQRSTPRTHSRSREIASGGQASVQTWQLVQKSSAPNTSLPSASERQVGEHAGEAEGRAVAPVDHRAVLAELAQPGLDRGRDQRHRPRRRPAMRPGVVARRPG